LRIFVETNGEQMAKLTKTVDTKVFDTYEARRRFLGATQAQIAQLLDVSTRTYITWVKVGTTEANAERIAIALKEYARKEAY